MKESRIRVLIVDDSAFMRKMVSDFLSTHQDIEVIGTARDGADALKKMVELKPTVVTLDIEMPVMDGLEALERIMDEFPVPVVMLSSSTKQGAKSTFHALQLGAVDFVEKTSGPISLDLHKIKDELIEKVLYADKVDVNRLKNKPVQAVTDQAIATVQSKTRKNRIHEWRSDQKRLILVGTSTGGPKALQTVLTQLPDHIGAPIIVVQHMPPNFTESLALRLDSLCSLTVKEAVNGDILQNDTVYLAAGGYHLELKKNGKSLALETNTKEPVNGHRPSVDKLFASASKLDDYYTVAVIMTGMGSDGTNGLIQLKETGRSQVIAESEQTCIVYGMPKAAITAGVVDYIVDVEDIPSQIMTLL